MIESLEDRRLMSASVQLHDGLLVIVGTDGADLVSVQREDQEILVHLNGQTTRFRREDVTEIKVRAMDGDDEINIGSSVKIDARIWGGGGDDEIVCGSGNDTVQGDAGDDWIIGRNGDDLLFGGRGQDRINGRRGRDYLHGGADDDRLRDIRGRNVFHGGAGRDTGLVDPALLGSSVESRRMFVRHGPGLPPSIHDVDDPQVSGTDLFRDDGNLVLEYRNRTASGSHRVEFSKFRLREDGMTEVEVTITVPPNGDTAIQYYSHRWNVDQGADVGLVFKVTHVYLSNEDGVTPIRSESQSTVLLHPPMRRSAPSDTGVYL